MSDYALLAGRPRCVIFLWRNSADEDAAHNGRSFLEHQKI
jgi:hypothetical protein